MSEQTQTPDLVTKLDVIPDLTGLNSFDAAIERAIKKVNQLDAAIKRVNNLKPASPYAPTATAAPTAATAAAVATVATVGANLVSRTPLAEMLKKEMQKVTRATVESATSGVAGLLPSPGKLLSGGGGGLMLPPPGGGVGGALPSPGGSFWPQGRAGGQVDAQAPRNNPFAHFDTSPSNFSGEPLTAKKTPVAEGVNSATRNPFNANSMLAGAGLTAGIFAAGNALSDSLDTIQRQQSQLERLKQTTGSAADAFFALNAAASDVKSDAGAFISTYANMATATEKLGLSQKETIEATQGLVSSLQLGGGSAEAVKAALYQMGQAFSSDRFGGDEFRSFMEAIGTMAPDVAKAFGTDVKGLREMSEKGKLTAETMVKAFQKMAASNTDLLKKQGWTWGQVTTVMKNDWQAFLAEATIGGEWKKFTDWAANTLIPMARGAEKELAAFWSTLADESKAAILVGILGAVGAAFTALAIPVLAALWPFLAIGAAVWLVYEAFVEWRAWMNGAGGTIFDSLFGSFDEFEKRYPNIMGMLNTIKNIMDKTDRLSAWMHDKTQITESDVPAGVKKQLQASSETGGFMDFINGVFGLFQDGGALSSTPPQIAQGQTTISNSGNRTTTINVTNAKEAAETVNSINDAGTIKGDLLGNIAESTGAI